MPKSRQGINRTPPRHTANPTLRTALVSALLPTLSRIIRPHDSLRWDCWATRSVICRGGGKRKRRRFTGVTRAPPNRGKGRVNRSLPQGWNRCSQFPVEQISVVMPLSRPGRIHPCPPPSPFLRQHHGLNRPPSIMGYVASVLAWSARASPLAARCAITAHECVRRFAACPLRSGADRD